MTDNRPYLGCADCGEPLFPATGRACDGGEHRNSCRCPHCDWAWYEEGPTKCLCGAWCVVDIDDGGAVVSEVEEPEP